MQRFNTPTAIVSWPATSSIVSRIEARIQERFRFENDPAGIPNELKGATCVVVDQGVVQSFTEPTVQRRVWTDPIEEQDIVLITSEKDSSTYQECRDLLNLACPVKTNNVVAFAAQPNDRLEAGFRISVAFALKRDLDGLNPRVDLYEGQSITGPAGILLGVAAELDQSAFCIVIEYAASSQFVSSAAIKAAILTFSRITAIETYRGQMSEQAIRMHKHLKKMAEQRNQEYMEAQANQTDHASPPTTHSKESYLETSPSIEDELRLAENVQWIEQLFDGIGDGKDRLDRARKVFLKSELDRLGLYDQFENRFLDLWTKAIN
jgi:proteasome assembly chaperone (PAC2) family protein